MIIRAPRVALLRGYIIAYLARVMVEATDAPSPSPKHRNTPSPTYDTVAQSTQLQVMGIYLAILAVLLGCLACMVKSCRPCEMFLTQTLGCQFCERVCCGKEKKGTAKASSWWLRLFSCMRPVGEVGGGAWLFQRQLFVLCWKRVTENGRSSMGLTLYYAVPALGLVVIKILYGAFQGFVTWRSSGLIETFCVPLLFVVAVQLTTVSLVNEKSERLRESLRIMNTTELPYWGSYICIDAVLQGFMLALMLSIMSAIMGLFWDMGQGRHGRGVGGFGDLLILLFMAAVAFTSVAFVISSCFDNSTAAAMMSFFVLVASTVVFVVLIISVPETLDSSTKQVLWCLFPPVALQIGVMTRFNYSAGLFAFVGEQRNVAWPVILGMLAADFFFYSFLAWYLGLVVPSRFGVSRPPWFCLQPSFWFPKMTQPSDRGVVVDRQSSSSMQPSDRLPSVCVSDLRKSFGTFHAVDGASFSLQEGEIFSLVGHNGAGKSTLINMLTGVLSPDADSGTTMIYGLDIKDLDDLAKARKQIGVCPQHNVLFSRLTTREHIIMYALLKGQTVTWAEAEEEADELLERFHLLERSTYLGNELSGGMKRKVSTAIAVCGKSKFVILDEPSAGMDALARRELWDLLVGLKQGRTILLTTHYMDEADFLGDTIGIMSRGKVLSCLKTLPHQLLA